MDNYPQRHVPTASTSNKPERVTWRYSLQRKGFKRHETSYMLSEGWGRGPATTKRRPRRRLDSWERLVCFVAAPPLSKYSRLLIPRRPFLSLFVPSHFIQACRGEDCSQSHWANSGEKRSLPSLLCSQENLPFFIFLFELQAVELSRWFDVRKLN